MKYQVLFNMEMKKDNTTLLSAIDMIDDIDASRFNSSCHYFWS